MICIRRYPYRNHKCVGDGLRGLGDVQILVVLFKLDRCQPTDLADHAYDSVWLCALEQAQEAGPALRAAAEILIKT